MPYPPYFHDDTGAVRFWILINGLWIGASVSRDTLHYRYRRDAVDDLPMDTYTAHAAELEDAVRARVARGSIEPVMLREHDLRPQ